MELNFVNIQFQQDYTTLYKVCNHVKTMQQLQMVCLAPIMCLTSLFEYLKAYYQISPKPESGMGTDVAHLRCPFI